ncbi:MAG: MarR family transcriptional regulator [Pseudobutyrivibrio ruminis]|jgi:DNA-binding MarR family transcriptional regulator|nr:MarR family transcriptional regulator [Pseudobutyrivibrio ruminis]
MSTSEFDSRNHIGFLCDSIGREARRAVTRGIKELNMDLCTSKNGWLIGYLVRQKEPIYQKDLEKVFHFPKSTLADIIQILEKDGLIKKVPVDGDGRKKQIIVTEKGHIFNEKTEAQIMEVEDFITKDITDEEIEMVVKVLNKMQENARNYKSYIELKKEE